MDNQLIIGLHGVARSGKDSVADHLQTLRPFGRYAFAGPLKKAMYTLNPQLVGFGLHGDLVYVRLQELVDAVGWEGAKDHATFGREVRRLLQVMGTEVARLQWSDTFWVDLSEKIIGGSGATADLVFTDIRFDNEAELIRAKGGYVWHITRPGYGPVNGHASDSGISPHLVDVVIDNYGTLEQLAATVEINLDAYLASPIAA